MTRVKYLKLATIGLAAMSLPYMAQAQNAAEDQARQQAITIAPGLYEINNQVTMSGFPMPAEAAQECIREGENSKTLDEIAASIGDGQCALSNVAMTQSTGRADFLCTPEGLGFEVNGTVEAEFGVDFLNLTGNGTLGPMGPASVKIEMTRIGDCPIDAP